MAFQFAKHIAVNQNIGDVFTHDYVLVANGNSLGNLGGKSGAPQFMNEGVLIDRLKKVGSERAMNFHREPDDFSVMT